MLLESSINITRLTDNSSGGAFATDCIPRWVQHQPDVTQASGREDIHVERLDNDILSLAATLEEFLLRFLMLLNDRCHFSQPNPRLEALLKRYILVAIAVSCVENSNLDRVLELNMQLPTLSSDALGELLETTSEILDFHSYLVGAVTTATQTRAVSGDFAGRFVRPNFPIVFDDD